MNAKIKINKSGVKSISCPSCEKYLMFKHDKNSNWSYSCSAIFCECPERREAEKLAVIESWGEAKEEDFIKEIN